MQLSTVPFFERLIDSKRILISGAGGGFDFLHSLPLYFSLRKQGKTVFLGNLTFSNLFGVNGKMLSPDVMEVDSNSNGSKHYFPEKHACRWFEKQGHNVSVQCFFRTGVAPLTAAYQAVCRHYEIDAIVLVDGGTDSLMRGDESGLGTPQEDMASLLAADALDLPVKLLACIGFGVDTFHGVCHAQFLESVAALAKREAFLGCFSLLAEMNEAALYKDCWDFVTKEMPDHPSIVASSIVSAIEGEFGNHHRVYRTQGSKLWINPLMNLYWGFKIGEVVERSLYAESIKHTESYEELTLAIQRFRSNCKSRDWEDIPV